LGDRHRTPGGRTLINDLVEIIRKGLHIRKNRGYEPSQGFTGKKEKKRKSYSKAKITLKKGKQNRKGQKKRHSVLNAPDTRHSSAYKTTNTLHAPAGDQ